MILSDDLSLPRTDLYKPTFNAFHLDTQEGLQQFEAVSFLSLHPRIHSYYNIPHNLTISQNCLPPSRTYISWVQAANSISQSSRVTGRSWEMTHVDAEMMKKLGLEKMSIGDFTWVSGIGVISWMVERARIGCFLYRT